MAAYGAGAYRSALISIWIAVVADIIDKIRLLADEGPRPHPNPTIGTATHPAIVSRRTSRTTAGVAEDITLALGYPAGHPLPLDAIEPLAAELVDRFGLTRCSPRSARAAPTRHSSLN
ncbi:DUF6177 family protein [Streptomyces sp. NPDC056982]|uniref:DUF6177 family protein n=1 Tax=Streptomyces sp. NPDC056982 TaxID=3345986 RepID=UPI00362EE210